MDDPVTPGKSSPTTPQIHAIELGLSYVLRGGVILSSATVIVGLVLMFIHNPNYLQRGASVSTVISAMAFPHTLGEVFAGISHGEGRSIILAGLIVLIGTPVARVAVSVVVFFHQRDRLFTVITLVVLLLLLTSFLLGRAGG